MAEYETHLFSNLQETLDKIVLENITSVSLNTDALKRNFEVIVSILRGLTKRVDQGQADHNESTKDIKNLKDRLEKHEDKQKHDKDELNEKIFGNSQQIKEVQGQTTENTKDIEKLQEALKEMKESQKSLADSNQNSIYINDVRKRLDQHDKQIQELMALLASSNNNNNQGREPVERVVVEVPSVQNNNNNNEALESLREEVDVIKQSLDNQLDEIRELLEGYVKKEEFNTYKDTTDDSLKNHQESIDDLYQKLKNLRELVGEKVGCDHFDEHVNDYNQIKNLVISLANSKGGEHATVVQQVIQSAGPGLSTKDTNLLKELGQKFPELDALVKKLQKDLNDHLLSFKNYAENTNNKIHNNEENLKHFKVDTNRKIAELEALYKSLKEQVAHLQAPSNNNTSPPKAATTTATKVIVEKDSTDHSSEIRKIMQSISTLADRLNNLDQDVSDLKQLKEKVQGLTDLTTEHKQKIANIEEELLELKALKGRIEILEILIHERDKEHGHKQNKTSKGTSFENSSPSGVTLEQVKQIVDEEINKLRDEIMALIEALKAALEKKCDSEDLYKSEAALLEKLDQIAGALMKRSQADKNDTKKALLFLEKKIKEISVLVLGPSNSEEGAIFAKKPILPWSCASCDSKLKDYPGPLIDYKNWNKLPQRETSPGRMTQGKFGKGWSKWVDNKRVTVEKTRDPFSGVPGKFSETLPEIHNNRDSAKMQQDSSRGD